MSKYDPFESWIEKNLDLDDLPDPQNKSTPAPAYKPLHSEAGEITSEMFNTLLTNYLMSKLDNNFDLMIQFYMVYMTEIVKVASGIELLINQHSDLKYMYDHIHEIHTALTEVAFKKDMVYWMASHANELDSAGLGLSTISLVCNPLDLLTFTLYYIRSIYDGGASETI